MIHVRCPISGEVFEYEDESEIPDGQVFERLIKARVTVQNGSSIALLGSSVREVLGKAVQLAQSRPIVISG